MITFGTAKGGRIPCRFPNAETIALSIGQARTLGRMIELNRSHIGMALTIPPGTQERVLAALVAADVLITHDRQYYFRPGLMKRMGVPR